MRIFFNAVTLLLIMDPLGNIPPFLSALKHVQEDRRRKVLVREILLPNRHNCERNVKNVEDRDHKLG